MNNLIEEFLKHWTDEYLWSPICNRIGKGYFSIVLEAGKELNISINVEDNQNDEDRFFWKHNITDFVNLYVFVLLDLWKETNPNSESIKNRFESYSQKNEIDIIAEFEKFIIHSDNSDFLKNHLGLVINIFWAMESYLWNSKRRASVLLEMLKKYNINTDNLYERYNSLLAQSLLKSPELLENIDLLFPFCYSTDGITQRSNCFRLIIEKIYGKNVDSLDIATMLKTMPKDRCSIKTYMALLNYFFVNMDIYNESGSDYLPFCLPLEERKFCIENLKSDKYTLLLPYVIIKSWNGDGLYKGELRHWIISFQGEEYKKKLEQEMKEFLHQFKNTAIDLKLINIVKEIGFAIDSYFFISCKGTPFLFEILNDNPSLLKDLYSKYVYLLSEQIKNYSRDDIKNSIEFIIRFCKATDIPVKKSNSFSALLQFLSGLYNEKNLSSMLIKILKGEPRDEMEQLGFYCLKSIVSFYCANYELYLTSREPLDIFTVLSMQRELWKIRIGDYLFKYGNFITSGAIIDKRVVYPEGICNPISDMDLFDIWRQYAKPWNYIEFCSKDNYKVTKRIIGENLLHNINSELDSKAKNVIKEAAEKSKNKEWAHHRLEYVIWCAKEIRIEKFSTELCAYLAQFKKEKIKECILKAFDDSQLLLWDVAPLSRSNIKIDVVLSDSKTVISISHEGEIFEISFLEISPKEIVPLKEMYQMVPREFISSYIDSYRNLLGWKDSPNTSKKEKSMECLTVFFKKYKNLAQAVVVYYLDFAYMDAINKLKNREEKNDTTIRYEEDTYSTKGYEADSSSPFDRSDYMWGLVGG